MNMFFSLAQVRSLLLMTLVLSVFAVGCKKSGTEVNPTPTNSAVEGNWHMSAMNINPALNAGPPFGTISDMMPLLIELSGSTCLTDLTLMFKGNGTISSDNPTSCKSLDPQETTGIDTSGKWALNGDKLTLTGSDGSKTVYTVSFNGNTMNWAYQDQMEDASGASKTYTVTIVFKKA